MAKFKVGDWTKFFYEQVQHLEGDIQLAVHKNASNKIAKMAAKTLETQMRVKGVRRAKATGSHDRRLPAEKIKAEKHGSMLDVYYKVWRSKDRSKSIIFAGQTSAGYKARFVNDGFSNWHWWGRNTGIDVKGKHFIESTHKIIEAEKAKIVADSIETVLKRRRKVKKTFTV